jgi:hypothetical protein
MARDATQGFTLPGEKCHKTAINLLFADINWGKQILVKNCVNFSYDEVRKLYTESDRKVLNDHLSI